MLDEKSKGKEIVIDKAPAPKHGQVIDIMEALKRSMERSADQKETCKGRDKEEEEWLVNCKRLKLRRGLRPIDWRKEVRI